MDVIPLTLDEAIQAIAFIPADDRQLWLNIGNALKSEFGDDAFLAWDSWSQGGHGYNAHDAQVTWKSLQLGKKSMGYVVNRAKENGWERELREMSAADKLRLKEEAEVRRKAYQAKVEADAAWLKVMQEKVSEACQSVLESHVMPTGQSPYLGVKRVGAHGVYFPKHSVLISIDAAAQRVDVWPGAEVKRFFENLPEPRPDHISFLLIKKGDIIVPASDYQGRVWSIQVIRANGGKMFPKFGRQAGCYHVLGDPQNAPVIAEVEGYATGASVHEATGWPVVIAFSTANMARVGQTIRLTYPDQRLVICGDDDPDNPKNPGRKKAQEVAAALGVIAAFPTLDEVA